MPLLLIMYSSIRSILEHQPQQYGHQVLELRLGEQLTELLGKVAQLGIQTYNKI